MYGRDARDRFFIFHTAITRQRYLFIAPYTWGKSGSRKINYAHRISPVCQEYRLSLRQKNELRKKSSDRNLE